MVYIRKRICLQFHSGADSKYNCFTQSLAIKTIEVYRVIENINAYNNYSFHLVRLEESFIYLSYITYNEET